MAEKRWRILRRRWICKKEKEENEIKFASGISSEKISIIIKKAKKFSHKK